jgi:hypothetical protein
MSDSRDIDRVTIAAALTAKSPRQFEIDAALEAIPAAPLTQTICLMLGESPNLTNRDVLERLAELNQGRLEDLDSPAFQSYLIRKLEISHDTLTACVRSICTFARVQYATYGDAENLLAAARSEDDTHSRYASVADVLRELRRRK